VVAACLRIFEAENTSELRSSRLIKLLHQQEVYVSSKQLKNLMATFGISLHRRSDANYYLREEFDAAASSIAPSLHPSTFQDKVDEEDVESTGPVEGMEGMEGVVEEGKDESKAREAEAVHRANGEQGAMPANELEPEPMGAPGHNGDEEIIAGTATGEPYPDIPEFLDRRQGA